VTVTRVKTATGVNRKRLFFIKKFLTEKVVF